MKKEIILALSLSLIFTSCTSDNKEKDKNISSENEISTKSNDKNNLLIGEDKKDNSNSSSKVSNSNEDKNTNSKNLSVKDLKIAMLDLGGFDQEFVNSLSDKEINEDIKKAEDIRNKTGFWDKLTLFFNQIAKDNPNVSRNYPMDSVNVVEETWQYSGDKNTDNYVNARSYIAQRGFDASEVSNGELKKLFFNIYEENKFSTYDEQIDMAYKKLLEKYPNGYEKDEKKINRKEDNENTDKKSQKKNSWSMEKFAENEEDYDNFRNQLVEQYGFSRNSVKKITNDDIDLANLRAQNKLKEEEFGDIGLIINELAKMYPGSSSMYPGDEK